MTLAAEQVCWIDALIYDRSGYNRYMSKSKNPITIARAIIRIGDAARNVNDYSLLSALHEMVEQLSQHGVKDTDVDMDLLLEYVEAADGCDYCRAGDGKPSVEKLTMKINQQLARRGQAQVEASDQSVLKFEPLVHLVTAAYAKNEDGTTAGLSIALVVNQDGSVDLPREHILMKIDQSIGVRSSVICRQGCTVTTWWQVR